MKASPAPVGSAPATGVAGTCSSVPSAYTTDPRSPSVTTISGTPSVRIADSSSSRPSAPASSSDRWSTEALSSSAGSNALSWTTGPRTPGRTRPCRRATAAAAGQARQSLGRGVAPPEGGGVHPVGSREGLAEPTVGVLRKPGLAERLDRHVADVVLVAEAEGRRGRLRPPRDSNPGCPQGPEQCLVLRGAARHDQPGLAECPQRARGIERRAARPRRERVDEIPRRVADDGEHGRRTLPVAGAQAVVAPRGQEVVAHSAVPRRVSSCPRRRSWRTTIGRAWRANRGWLTREHRCRSSRAGARGLAGGHSRESRDATP